MYAMVLCRVKLAQLVAGKKLGIICKSGVESIDSQNTSQSP